MSPFKPTQLPSPAEQEERLAAAMKATVVLPATEVDSSGAAAQRQVGEWFEGDPPKTEPEILAAVRATRDQILTETVSPPAVMELICRRTQYLTDASGAVIEFLEGTELVYRAASGSAARSLGLRVDTCRSMSGLCFRTGEVMRCDDTDRDDRVDKAACLWVGIRSMVLVPVVREGRPVGVLAVISGGVAAFGDRDEWTLRLMAEVLAEALGPGPFEAGPATAGGSRPK